MMKLTTAVSKLAASLSIGNFTIPKESEKMFRKMHKKISSIRRLNKELSRADVWAMARDRAMFTQKGALEILDDLYTAELRNVNEKANQ